MFFRVFFFDMTANTLEMFNSLALLNDIIFLKFFFIEVMWSFEILSILMVGVLLVIKSFLKD